MFCEKCGTKLPEDAVFCTNCGSSVGKIVNAQEKIIDNEVQLNVKPIFKLGYMMISDLMIVSIILLIFAPMFLLLVNIAKSMLTFFLLCAILIIGMYLIWITFRKKQYDNYSYDFYKTKVIYKDGFLNKSEKEVKYKHIREVSKRESFFQRFFNLGTIILYTNAETGYASGIHIINVENIDDVYNKIKDIIDE